MWPFRSKPRTAVVLHIFYEDVAMDIIDRLAGAKSNFTLFVTHNRPLSVPIMMRLYGLRRPLVFVMTDNVGRDLWPFFEALRHSEMAGHDLICKMHTKRGPDHLNATWRDEMLDKTVGTGRTFDAVAKALRRDRSILIAGPERTYISAKKFMYENKAGVDTLAKATGLDTSQDWGFFAGTMFWARRDVFDPLLPHVSEHQFHGNNKSDDGEFAHAVERIIGLLGARSARAIHGDGAVEPVVPSKTSIRNTFEPANS